MMQLGKGQSNSVAVTLNGDGYIICMAPRPPGSYSELICLAQGQHGAASATVIDPMTPMLYHYVTTLPIYFMFVCLFVCLLELVFNVPVKS